MSADDLPARVPAKRRRGQQPTYTPARLGGVASALLQGDTVKAACASAAVPPTTYVYWMQRGELTLNEAREALDDDDIEGQIWEWVNAGGGFGTADRTQWYWTSDPPEWWPDILESRWTYALFAVVALWARGKAEQIYRTSITRAAQGDPARGIVADWRAAQFMLTHSFGWRSADRIEVTGKDGGPIETVASEDQVLSALEKLAQRRQAMMQAGAILGETVDDDDRGH